MTSFPFACARLARGGVVGLAFWLGGFKTGLVRVIRMYGVGTLGFAGFEIARFVGLGSLLRA